jgi:hypothetical protein
VRTLLWLSLLVLGPTPLHAQEADSLRTAPTSQLYRIETTDGNTLVGTLVSETEEAVVLRTRSVGEVTLQRDDIERMGALDSARLQDDGTYWFPNPQSTRYFVAPNALGLPRGHGYYQNTWVLFNNLNYGVSNNLSIGAGTVPLFLFGAGIMPIWALPKVSASVPGTSVHLATGAVVGGVVGGGSSLSAGLLYGAATVGTRNHNATLGVGYGYADGDLSRTPVINVSAMTRLTQTVYLLSESYIVPSARSGVLSFGVRWAPESFAVDFGLFRFLSPDADSVIALPWLGVTIPFGE